MNSLAKFLWPHLTHKVCSVYLRHYVKWKEVELLKTLSFFHFTVINLFPVWTSLLNLDCILLVAGHFSGFPVNALLQTQIKTYSQCCYCPLPNYGISCTIFLYVVRNLIFPCSPLICGVEIFSLTSIWGLLSFPCCFVLCCAIFGF